MPGTHIVRGNFLLLLSLNVSPFSLPVHLEGSAVLGHGPFNLAISLYLVNPSICNEKRKMLIKISWFVVIVETLLGNRSI